MPTLETPSTTKPPAWLKVKAPTAAKYNQIQQILSDLTLKTVCQSAICPNLGECWGGGTATFMLMGDTCTRACKFCAVKTGNPGGVLDPHEPMNIGHAIDKLQLKYVVLTSVDRDDIPDLGAQHFRQTIDCIKKDHPNILIETLTPDFNARQELIAKIVNNGVNVFAHNIETVERITPIARDRRSSYCQSLNTLQLAKAINPQLFTKSSLMLGLGEKAAEVFQSLKDLREVGCDIVTLGQYLAPTQRHKKFLPIVEYVTPAQFKYYKEVAQELGFLYVASGPLVRSSYKAGEVFLQSLLNSDESPHAN